MQTSGWACVCSSAGAGVSETLRSSSILVDSAHCSCGSTIVRSFPPHKERIERKKRREKKMGMNVQSLTNTQKKEREDVSIHVKVVRVFWWVLLGRQQLQWEWMVLEDDYDETKENQAEQPICDSESWFEWLDCERLRPIPVFPRHLVVCDWAWLQRFLCLDGLICNLLCRWLRWWYPGCASLKGLLCQRQPLLVCLLGLDVGEVFDLSLQEDAFLPAHPALHEQFCCCCVWFLSCNPMWFDGKWVAKWDVQWFLDSVNHHHILCQSIPLCLFDACWRWSHRQACQQCLEWYNPCHALLIFLPFGHLEGFVLSFVVLKPDELGWVVREAVLEQLDWSCVRNNALDSFDHLVLAEMEDGPCCCGKQPLGFCFCCGCCGCVSLLPRVGLLLFSWCLDAHCPKLLSDCWQRLCPCFKRHKQELFLSFRGHFDSCWKSRSLANAVNIKQWDGYLFHV